jgi:bacterioferritin-associated ferredoxin
LGQQNGSIAPGKIDRALREHQAGNEASFAKLLGQAVAIELAQMLGQLLPQMPWREDCYFCIVSARQMVRAYQVAVTTAEQAAEPVPDPPAAPQVARAVTHVPVTQLVQTPAGPVPGTAAVPACWDHVQVQGEGPRPTGLVLPDGRPIVHRGG